MTTPLPLHPHPAAVQRSYDQDRGDTTRAGGAYWLGGGCRRHPVAPQCAFRRRRRFQEAPRCGDDLRHPATPLVLVKEGARRHNTDRHWPANGWPSQTNCRICATHASGHGVGAAVLATTPRINSLHARLSPAGLWGASACYHAAPHVLKQWTSPRTLVLLERYCPATRRFYVQRLHATTEARGPPQSIGFWPPRETNCLMRVADTRLHSLHQTRDAAYPAKL